MKVIPLGCADRLHRELIDYLMREDAEALLIDIRLMPNAIASGWNLTALKERWGARYWWFGPSLGDRNHHTNRSFNIGDLESGLIDLEELLWHGATILLMCECVSYRECHRQLIATMLIRNSPEFEILLPEYIQGRRVLLERFHQEREALEQELSAPKPTLPQRWLTADYERRLFGDESL